MKAKLKNILPWLVAAGVFGWLFYIHPPHKVWNALQLVHLPIFIPFALGYFFLIYFADVFSLSRVLKRFGFKVPMRDIWPARGVTYLLMVLNYGAAQAGFAYYLKRTKRIPIWEALSIFTFIGFIDLYWVFTLAFVGSFFQEYQIGALSLKWIIWGLAAAAVILFGFNLAFWRGRLFPKKKWKILEWVRSKDIFKLFKEATLGDYLKVALLRTPIHVSLIFSTYILLQTFGTYCPFLPILGSFPIVMLVGILPITPGGLGTSNATMVELLYPYITFMEASHVTNQDLLLAASILWMVSNYLLKVLFGMICLKMVSKDLFKATPQAVGEAPGWGQNLPI